MYLAELKIWNFRKFGETSTDKETLPGIHLHFNKNLNLLVGENDSGKTAIIDAIKYVLQTRSYDPVRLVPDDFHLPEGSISENDRTESVRIECIFRGFEIEEAKNFLEWLAIGENDDYWLRVFLVANRKERKVTFETRAGLGEGSYFNEGARDLLRTTYLKPLRDAENELAPRRGSRISQILDSHEAFQEKDDHQLIKIVRDANRQIEDFFKDDTIDNGNGKKLNDDIDTYLGEFSDTSTPLSSRFSIASVRLRGILERLRLNVLESDRKSNELDVYPGLGSHNLLFIAAELLLLKVADYEGLRLALVEEIEAHLHPQAQLRLIDYLQQQSESSNIQLILTSHSPILASKVKLESLIICRGQNAFPMADQWTNLESQDYGFLERFLDSTKANLFFARGVILVEGDAENLLIPAIANIIELPLAKHGISIVNVGSTAFLRYARIFQRESEPEMGIRVAVVTDLDIKPDEFKNIKEDANTYSDYDVNEVTKKIEGRFSGQSVRTFVSPQWTLEYCIALVPELREALLASIGCARAEKNQAEITQEKLQEIKDTARVAISDYSMGTGTDEFIAFDIYQRKLLDRDLSKAITAQWLAKYLIDEKEKYRPVLENNPNIRYLIAAIRHAAGMADISP